MIYDTLENLPKYLGISKNLDTAIRYAMKADFAPTAPDTYPVDGEKVYCMVQTPALKPREDTKWEVHRRYIDIQIGLTDGEAIGYAPMESLGGWEPYQDAKDAQLSFEKSAGIILPLDAQTFAIFFPWDAHRPCEKLGDAAQNKKAVIKVMVE